MKRYTLLTYIVVLMLCAVSNNNANARGADKAMPLQMVFVANNGQVYNQLGKHRADVDFVLKGKGLNLYIGNGALHYQWNKPLIKDNGKQTNPIVESYRMDVVLEGANPTAVAETALPQTYFEHYYGPAYGNEGIRAASCKKITYKNIYPHIDWVLYIQDEGVQSMKYDFVVNPGGNVADIKIKYSGAKQLSLHNGEVMVTTPMGTVTEAAPYSYFADSKETVSSQYVLTGNTLSFKTNADKPNQTMVIDPSLEWSTYFGGNNQEFAYSVASDTAGYSYLVGQTNSTSGVATTGAYQTSYVSNTDAFIAKFDDAGMLLWATYYGGSGTDNFFYVTADTLNGVYVAGITSTTTGMATTGAHQSIFGGGVSDAYMVKFDANGSRQWATYFGGGGDEAVTASFDDYMVSIRWDKVSNCVYLCGMTTSTSGIATSGAHQITAGGSKDGYLAKFNSAGALQWATYYGGSGDDKVVKISTDNSGNVYATGPTNSTSGIATTGTHLGTLAGGVDAYIAKFNSSGTRQWGTYMGGSNDDGSSGIANDNVGDIYIAGATTSTTGIATTGSFQPSIAGTGPTDAYLIKFNPSGIRQWGTYLGGISPDNTSDIDIDANNNICFSGTTGSVGIATPGAYQQSFGGNSDAFIAVFGPQGTRTWVSYVGGTDADNCFGISYSRTGDLFIAGNTSSTGSIASPGAFQMVLNGSQDGFLAKFKADTSAYISVLNPLTYCAGDSMTIQYAITNPFLSGNVFSVQLSDQYGSFGVNTTLGSVTSSLPGTIRVKIPENTVGSTLYKVRMAFTAPGGVGYAHGQNITIRIKPDTPTVSHNTPICSGNVFAFTANSNTTGVSYSWTGPGGFTSSTQTDVIVNVPTKASGRYVVTATLNGCISRDSFLAVVDSTPVAPIVAGNGNVCAGNTIVLTSYTATAGSTYTWSGPSGFSSTLPNVGITGATVGMSGYYVSTVSLLNCTMRDSTLINVYNTLTPDVNISIFPGANICLGDLVSFAATASGGGSAPTYQWYRNGVPINGATSFQWQSNTLVTGDVISCVYNGVWPCLTKPRDTSNSFTINASGNVPPTVTIRANPGLTVPTGTAITFLASHTNMGNSPNYRWMKNGTTVLAGKTPVYIATVDVDIKTGDKVSLVMNSDLVCAEPDTAISNTLTIGNNLILTVPGTDVAGNWQLFPNPNNGNFTLKGISTAKQVAIEVTDAVGRVLHKEQIQATNGSLQHNVQTKNLPAGVYLLRINSGEASGYLRFSVVF